MMASAKRQKVEDIVDDRTGHWLTDAQRDAMVSSIASDGYCILPFQLSPELCTRAVQVIDRIAAEKRRADPSLESVQVTNAVDEDVVFRELLMYPPMLQLGRDLFGPGFHLCQSNFFHRIQDKSAAATASDGGGAERRPALNFLNGSPWHADGPRPKQFPGVPPTGAMGLVGSSILPSTSNAVA